MARINSVLDFGIQNQNMWGTGSVGVNQTWNIWAINQHLSQTNGFGFNASANFLVGSANVSASLSITTAADIKFGLQAVLTGTTGDVDIDYKYDSNIYTPNVALAGSRIEINTDWLATYQHLNSTSPNFAFDLGLAYQFDASVNVNYSYSSSVTLGGGNIGGMSLPSYTQAGPSGGGSLFSTSFGTGGLQTIPIVHLGMNPDASGTSSNYFEYKLFNSNTQSLAGNASINFDNWLGLPVTGFLGLPRGVTTSATNTTPTQNDTLSTYGKSPAFFEFGVDVDKLAGMMFGVDTSMLSGHFSLPLGGGSIDYELLDIDLVADTSLVQKFTFDPGKIIVQMTSSLGEVHRGVLGDSFIFNTPTSGSGKIDFSTKYYLSGILTNDTGLSGTVYADLDVLNFQKWALIDKQIPLLSSDLYLFQKDIPVDFAPQNSQFQVQYSDVAASGDGSNAAVFGKDNKFNFDLHNVSNFKIELTGLDSWTQLWLHKAGTIGWVTFDNMNAALNSANGRPTFNTNSLFSIDNLGPGSYDITIQKFDSIGWIQNGIQTADGFNVNYSIERVNHAPIYSGPSSLVAIENHTATLNLENIFSDADKVNGDTLTYSFTVGNGEALPSWITVDPLTKVINFSSITGTQDVLLHVIATDQMGATAAGDINISTPSPTDNAGNSISTAHQFGTLNTIAGFIDSGLDYVGSNDDAHDFYSFSITETSNLNFNIHQTELHSHLDFYLLNSSGEIISQSIDSNIDDNSDSLSVVNLTPGNYYLDVQAAPGMNTDYNLSISNSAKDTGGSFSSPTIIELKTGTHSYQLTDYVSYFDYDVYDLNISTPTYIAVANLSERYDDYYYTADATGNLTYGPDGSYKSGILSDQTFRVSVSPDHWVTTEFRLEYYGFFQTRWVPYDVYHDYSGPTSIQLIVDRLPTVVNPILDQNITVSQAFSFVISANVFQDLDADAMLSIMATCSDGSALPSWLTFDPKTLTFSGKNDSFVDPVSIKLTAGFIGTSATGNITRYVSDVFNINSNISDGIGNNHATAASLGSNGQSAVLPIASSDGNDYFKFDQLISNPVQLQLSGLPIDAIVTLENSSGVAIPLFGPAAVSGAPLVVVTPELTSGRYFLHVQTSATSSGYSVYLNTNYQTPASTDPKLTSGSDSGLLSNDNITNDTTPTMTGTAAANEKVNVYDGGILIGATTSDATGQWTFTSPTLSSGLHAITVKGEDAAGNLSAASSPLNITLDTSNPAVVDHISVAETIITEISNLPIHILSGKADPSTLTTITVDGNLLGTTPANTSGGWNFLLPELAEGAHKFSVTSEDIAGNKSESLDIGMVYVDTSISEIQNDGNTFIIGNNSFNTVSFKNVTSSISIDLSLNTQQDTGLGLKTLVGIEGIIGGGFNDVIHGNDGNNILDGGQGADRLSGGKGDDVYMIDNVDDAVIEKTNEGNDTVFSNTLNYTLSDNVENLGFYGSLNLNGIGNSLNNVIIGNTGKNNLNGGAGNDKVSGGGGNDTLVGMTGADLLTGDDGNDVFQYLGASDSTLAEYDTITDFGSNDKIDFVGMTGISLLETPYTYGADLSSTLASIGSDTRVSNSAVYFNDGTDGYLFVKGSGSGVSFDGTLIKLSDSLLMPAAAQLMGVGIPNHSPTISGVPQASQVVNTGVAAALADFTVDDVDNGSLNVSLTAVNGVINGVTDIDLHNDGIQLAGSIASINAQIAGATFTATNVGIASIAISVNDGEGGTGTGIYNLTATTLPNRAPYGNVGLTGSAGVNQVLTVVTSGLVDPDGISGPFTYQWLKDGAVIAGAMGSSYTVVNGDSGHGLSVRVSYVDNAGHSESMTSFSMSAYGGTPVTPPINHSPYGGVSLTGSGLVGQQLTANTSGLVDPDGIPSGALHYQWLRDGVTISGATLSSYTVSNGDSGHGLNVRVTYTDGAGFNESVSSAAMSAYGGTPVTPPVNHSPYGGVSLTGSGLVGQQLIANTSGLVDPDGIPSGALHYQWLRDGVTITGATLASYTVANGDSGHGLSVQVTYRDGAGFDELVSSAAMSAYGGTPVIPAVNHSPYGGVGLRGSAQVGSTLQAYTGDLVDPDGIPNNAFHYQWLRDNVAIASAADSSSYLVDQVDAGHGLSVQVSYIDNGGHSEVLTSYSMSSYGLW